jgi:hypothetical protein
MIIRCPRWPGASWFDPMTANTNWTQDEWSGSTACTFAAGGCSLSTTINGAAQIDLQIYKTAALSQHQKSTVTFQSATLYGVNSCGFGAVVRNSGSGTTPTQYYVYVNSANAGSTWNYQIGKTVSGTNTTLNSSSGVTAPAANDVYELEASAPVGGVTTLTLYKNGSSVLTTTDNTSITGTSVGVMLRAGSDGSHASVLTVNNWSGNTNP